MEFFVHHHGRAGSEPLRERMVEAHWAYMDRFADHLIARGPTFTQETLVGSVHIVDLPDPAAARAFAFEEPCYQAGAFDGVLIHRWRNRLGRDMWAFPDRAADADRFLVLGLGVGTDEDQPRTDPATVIAYGPLLSDDASTWLGTAALVQATDPDAASRVLDVERYDSVEVTGWTFGGRR